MKRSTVLALGLAALMAALALMPAASARPAQELSSTFDSGTDGWTMVGDAEGATGLFSFDLQPQYTATEGNPGGAIFAVDEAKGLAFFFQAPPKYLGNQRANYGMALEFDVRATGPDELFSRADVILAGADLTLVVNAGPEPGEDWTSYRVQLDESAEWRLSDPVSGALAAGRQIRKVLGDLSVLLIRGEYVGGVDTGYLDNVRMGT